MKKIITHSGSFHADDVMAVAMLSIMLDRKGETYEIVRSRDSEVWKSGDYVVDVGGIYDPATARYDHHQIGGAGKREDGSPYSSVGLVWKHYGMELAGGDEEVWKAIDKRVVTPLDLGDNGVETYAPLKPDTHPYLFHNIISAFRARWDEGISHDEMFLKIQPFVKELVEREILSEVSEKKGRSAVLEAYDVALDKRVIVMDRILPWEGVMAEKPEVLFVVTPRVEGSWQAKTVARGDDSFSRRALFPKEWAGKTGEELSQISGIPGAIFCHNGRFVAAAKSKEGAITMTKIALES